MDKKTIALAAVALLLCLGVVIASSVYWEATSGTEFDAVDGPAITLKEDVGLTVADPFPDNDTVDLGNITFTGAAASSANVSGIESDYTVLSDVKTDGSGLSINHTDKNNVTLTSQLNNGNYQTISSFEWTSINPESTATEWRLPGNTRPTIEFAGLQPGQGYRINQDSAPDKLAEANSNGRIEVNLSSSGTIVEAATPQLSNPYPQNNEELDKSTVDLQFELFHDDFSTGSATIDWKVNGTQVKSTTTNQEGLQSISTSQFGDGKNNWSAVVTDSTGDTATINGSFGIPTTLELRSEQNPGSLVTTSATANVTFFGEDGSTSTRTTTSGKIDMSGLPLDTPFTVQVEANGYITRQSYVRSVIERQTIYLLEDTVTSVESNFVVEDPTGEFAPDNSRVFVKKPIERNGTTQYETIVGDIAGFGGFATTLEQDQRYLLEVENIETGETRELGPYVARVSETVALKIDQLNFDFSSATNDVPYDFEFDVINRSSGTAVDLAFGAEERIEKLNVVVHERNNKSNEILNRSFRNRDGTVDLRRFVPPEVENPDDRSWVVKWDGVVGGEEVGGSELAGRDLAISPTGLPQHILSIVGIFLILIIGGLFSAANLTVGAIVVALVSGGLWTVGVIPGAVSGPFIAVALAVGIMFHARRGPNPPR